MPAPSGIFEAIVSWVRRTRHAAIYILVFVSECYRIVNKHLRDAQTFDGAILLLEREVRVDRVLHDKSVL